MKRGLFHKVGLLWKYRRQAREALSTELEILSGGHGADALGGMTDEEEKGICAILKRVETENGFPPIIIEMGTLFGLTTQLMAEKAPVGASLITVDNFCWNPFGLPSDMHRKFTKRILRPYLESGRVRLEDKDSVAFRDGYCGKRPSMVFFDADHSYEAVRDEIAWAKKLGVPMICGHDYRNPSGFGVTRAVDEAFPEGVETAGMVWWHAKQ